nr:unnamed protein product [Digitaria exilis]
MVEEVCRSIEKDKERYGELCAGLKFIKKEMEAVTGLMKDKDKVCRGAVQEIRIQQLQELAYDVEDFLESLRDPGQGAYGKLLVAIRMDPRPEQLRSIDRFKVTLSSITADLKQSAESNKGEADAMSDDEDEEAVEQLEAMDGPKSKIVELLKPSPGEGQQLRVISIVGCHGVGKTALARAVYHKYYSSSDEFDCVAWVTAASGCNNKKALLDKILHKVRADLASRAPHHTENDAPTEAQGGSTTKPNLHDILSDKSVVLEYIIQKSVAKNVVSLIQGHEPVLKGSTEACVRRLSIQSSSKERFDELDQDKKSALRSLTMFKTAPCDLRRCKMLRVLDLEGCNGLDQEFLESLCELLLLKYLNLRKTRINKIPPKIEKLQRLETLDIRETKVERLPMQVIMLPELAYLFGKFQLPEDHDCPWKKTEERRSNNTDFIKLLLKMRVTPLESVSIVSSSEVCNDFLGSLEGPIKKLQLFSTGLTIKDLSALQVLRGLEYLKLVEYNDRFFNGVFIVEKKGFESLKSLCIDAPKMPSGIIEGISHLSNLSEVILHSSMQQAWETVADGHPNRPCVKRQPPEPTGNTVA